MWAEGCRGCTAVGGRTFCVALLPPTTCRFQNKPQSENCLQSGGLTQFLEHVASFSLATGGRMSAPARETYARIQRGMALQRNAITALGLTPSTASEGGVFELPHCLQCGSELPPPPPTDLENSPDRARRMRAQPLRAVRVSQLAGKLKRCALALDSYNITSHNQPHYQNSIRHRTKKGRSHPTRMVPPLNGDPSFAR